MTTKAQLIDELETMTRSRDIARERRDQLDANLKAAEENLNDVRQQKRDLIEQRNAAQWFARSCAKQRDVLHGIIQGIRHDKDAPADEPSRLDQAIEMNTRDRFEEPRDTCREF